MLNHDTNFISEDFSKSSRFLRRDFTEIQNMNSASKAINNYANNSMIKFHELLMEMLEEKYPNVISINQLLSQHSLKEATLMIDEKNIIVDLIDNINHFKRSIEHFGSIVHVIKTEEDNINLQSEDEKYRITSSILQMHALKKSYVASYGKGVFLKDYDDYTEHRIKLSSNKRSTLIAISPDVIHKIKDLNCDMRIYGSDLYSFSLFLSGSIDSCILSKNRINNLLKLFIIESGAFYKEYDDYICMGTNSNVDEIASKYLK
ncbi:MAG TPA: hypothetical protein QKA14_02000 [Candidatus Megaira endosymbiont of Hartmannula sinica]|nr:hypothetical protein [Candidatus Megaera endosymbiont of Hartmannula sinica]